MPGARRSVATARRPVFAVVQAFTGLANGAAWPGYTTVAGIVDVQNEKGRTLTTADAYAVAGAYKVAANPPNFDLTANTTITTVTATEFYGIINVRAGTNTFTDVRQHSSWNLRFYGGVGIGICELWRVDAAGVYSATALAAGSDIDFVQTSVLRVRVRCEASTIKARYWKNAETEPSTWQIDYTDATPPTGTGMSLLIRNGNDLAADRWDWDDITITTLGATVPTGTVVKTLSNATAVISGTSGSGGSFAAPIASAINGMSATPYKDYDWQGGTLHGDWNIVDGDDTPNGERSASKPSNVTFIADASVSSGFYMRCTMRQESYAGQPYTGVQMENFYGGPAPGAGAGSWRGYGQGSPFFVEVRLRWVGWDGFWCGPWMYDLTSAAEVDIMETINNRSAKNTLHSPDVATNDYTAALPDGQWHRYGLRFDTSGVYRYYDNVLVSSVVNSSIGTAFCNANMGFKFQAFVGGTWPDSDAGHVTPIGVTFPQFFDCDWVRLYR